MLFRPGLRLTMGSIYVLWDRLRHPWLTRSTYVLPGPLTPSLAHAIYLRPPGTAYAILGSRDLLTSSGIAYAILGSRDLLTSSGIAYAILGSRDLLTSCKQKKREPRLSFFVATEGLILLVSLGGSNILDAQFDATAVIHVQHQHLHLFTLFQVVGHFLNPLFRDL